MAMTKILRALHTALNVTDLVAAEQFYATALGLTPVNRDLNFAGTWYQIGDFQLHLIVQPIVPPIQDPEKWGRNRHLAFSVADVNAVAAHLEQLQLPFQRSTSGRPALFVHDPDGNVIELGEV
jgi:glyoxylase I family protein